MDASVLVNGFIICKHFLVQIAFASTIQVLDSKGNSFGGKIRSLVLRVLSRLAQRSKLTNLKGLDLGRGILEGSQGYKPEEPSQPRGPNRPCGHSQSKGGS